MDQLFATSLSKYVKPTSVPQPVPQQVEKQDQVQKTEQDSESEVEQVAQKIKHIKDDPEKSKRTLFIGNLSQTVMQKANKLKALLRQPLVEGQKLESIRFRSIALKKPTQDHKMRKVSILHADNLHPDSDTVNAYAVFSDEAAVGQCIKQLNGTVFEERHIRLDHADHKKSFDNKRTVFIGNLPLNITEEVLWLHFQDKCAEVEGVRVVRDSAANVGKGIAYVCFKDVSGVKQALKLNGKPSPVVGDKAARPMRVSTCVRKLKKTKQFEGQHASKSATRRLKSKKRS